MKSIYARNTTVRTIDNELSIQFIEENHRSGAVKSVKMISVGLFDKNEILVAVAQFCSPRTSKKKKAYSTELLRLCFKESYQVQGGASKLIDFYISKYSPSDIFTYQDTNGSATDLYKHAGFSLKSSDSKKKLLLHPDYADVQITQDILTEARKSNKSLSTSYASKLGPDKILGTNLGEVFDPETGNRKSNIQLFEDLGWKIISVSGDRVYEWFNPNITFYTYKITSNNSPKYYYGVSHVKIANASNENCMNDGYYGSGGNDRNNKFNNWKKKHKKDVIKTVIETFSTKSKAYNAEKELIGELYKNDPLCLNSIAGGSIGKFTSYIPIFFCKTHGDAKHIGNKCMKCTSEKTVIEKDCITHGLSFHQGDFCLKCLASENYSIQECSIHGKTKFNKHSCAKCSYDKTLSQQDCNIHGKTKFKNNKCGKCFAEEAISIKLCPIHGETKHQGDACRKCMASKNITKRTCEIHGLTKFRNELCMRCIALDSFKLNTCNIHGITKFRGSVCLSCKNSRPSSISICEVHGETKFYGSSCSKCSIQKKYTVKYCEVHGESQHNGDTCVSCQGLSNFSILFCDACNKETQHNGKTCLSCSSQDSLSESFCNICERGTTHKGSTCLNCSAQSTYVVKTCETHGMSKHKGNTCLKCVVKKNSIEMKDCIYHGLTKHNKDNCYSCRIEKTTHTRFHNNKKKESCRLCL